MSTIVICQSKTGFTRKYAEWIAKELNADLLEGTKVTQNDLNRYDLIIYGGGLYAGGINGAKKILGKLKPLQGKKVIVFATGLSPARPEIIREIAGRNFSPEQKAEIPFFYLRGGFDTAKLSALDRFLMNIMKRMLKRKKNPTQDEQGMLAAYDQPLDFTKKEDLDELIVCARALEHHQV